MSPAIERFTIYLNLYLHVKTEDQSFEILNILKALLKTTFSCYDFTYVKKSRPEAYSHVNGNGSGNNNTTATTTTTNYTRKYRNNIIQLLQQRVINSKENCKKYFHKKLKCKIKTDLKVGVSMFPPIKFTQSGVNFISGSNPKFPPGDDSNINPKSEINTNGKTSIS